VTHKNPQQLTVLLPTHMDYNGKMAVKRVCCCCLYYFTCLLSSIWFIRQEWGVVSARNPRPTGLILGVGFSPPAT